MNKYVVDKIQINLFVLKYVIHWLALANFVNSLHKRL